MRGKKSEGKREKEREMGRKAEAGVGIMTMFCKSQMLDYLEY